MSYLIAFTEGNSDYYYLCGFNGAEEYADSDIDSAVRFDSLSQAERKADKVRERYNITDVRILDEADGGITDINGKILIFEPYVASTKKMKKMSIKKMDIREILDSDESFRYQMLGRLQSDMDYYFGNGNKHDSVLWAGDFDTHVSYMRQIYNSLEQKPDWITLDEIEGYAMRKSKKMKKSDSDWVIYGREKGRGRYKIFTGDGFATNIIYGIRYPSDKGNEVREIVEQLNRDNPDFEFEARRGRGTSLFGTSDDEFYDASSKKMKKSEEGITEEEIDDIDNSFKYDGWDVAGWTEYSSRLGFYRPWWVIRDVGIDDFGALQRITETVIPMKFKHGLDYEFSRHGNDHTVKLEFIIPYIKNGQMFKSAKKSYTPDYHDFRTMLTNMRVTKDNRTVFKR